MKSNVLKLTLSALFLALLSGCSDTKESLKVDMAELKSECKEEAEELKEAKDKEGFGELMKRCEEQGKEIDTKLQALEKEAK